MLKALADAPRTSAAQGVIAFVLSNRMVRDPALIGKDRQRSLPCDVPGQSHSVRATSSFMISVVPA